MTKILIGIDDTDNKSSPGTGRLARDLAALCCESAMRLIGVTRHQFLVHPDIPYTSHNSGACIALVCDKNRLDSDFIFDFVRERSVEGADPGVAVAVADKVPQPVIDFGRAAAVEILQMADAFDLARRTGIDLRGLGGSSQGVIGALAAVGQHAGGNDGRFIDLPGLRQLSGCIDGRLYGEIGIALEHRVDRRPPRPDDVYDTLDWVRPKLTGGRPVLTVQWSSDANAWIPVDRKKNHPNP